MVLVANARAQDLTGVGTLQSDVSVVGAGGGTVGAGSEAAGGAGAGESCDGVVANGSAITTYTHK